jgi:VWFA-related protein
MKLLSSTFIVLTVLLFASAASEQTPTPQTNGGDVVKITTNLVQIDATVLDKNGKTVTNLSADDFEIYENNKKQRITNFSFIELQPDKSDATATEKPAKDSASIPSVPNRLRPERVKRTLALVVDDLGLSFGSVDAVKSALRKFIDEQMQPDDLVAIIRTSKGAGVLQQLTSDKRILRSAIEKVRWYPEGRGSIGVFQQLDISDTNTAVSSNSQTGTTMAGITETRAAQERFNKYREDIFAAGTLGAINYVVKGMRELPGRKAVVLFSDGFGLYDLDNGIKKPNPRLIDNLRRLTELANRSSVVIYTMDARGLAVPMLEAGDNTAEFDQSTVIEQVNNDRATALYETQQGLHALAEATGGFAVINRSDLSKGLQRILSDQKGYYLLGYRPDSESFDPKKVRYNKLIVKLKRPDLRVRYRSGFFGVKDEETKPQPKTPRQQIIAALTSPLSSGDIDLRLTSLFANDAQTGPFMRSLVYVNGGDLKFTDDAGGWQEATFDIVAMIFGDNGTVVDEVSRTETIKARAETLQEIREKGFVSTITVPIKKPGAYQMHVVMRDATTSRVGSASQFIEVPSLKKDRLTLSGILLQRLPPQSKGDKIATAQRQFQSDAQRDFAVRRFHPGDIIRLDLSVYNAAPAPADKPNLVMQYKVYRDGKEIFAAPEKALNLTQQADLQSVDCSEAFTLGRKMPAGDYVLQVLVKDSLVKGKNQTATQWTDFEIVQ